MRFIRGRSQNLVGGEGRPPTSPVPNLKTSTRKQGKMCTREKGPGTPSEPPGRALSPGSESGRALDYGPH